MTAVQHSRSISDKRSTAIAFHDVALDLGGQAIYDKVSFEVYDGEFLCLLGPSGCGKSTSLRIIGDLLMASAGEVSVQGSAPAQKWRELAYVFQAPRLVPWRTALRNVMLGVELRYPKRSKQQNRQHALALLDMVGLAADADKYPRALSGGERQRVAIARALAVEPQIILMDEPFSALDINTRRRMRSEIIDIWRNTGKTIIFVTHDVDEALLLADRIILLSNKPTRVLQTITIAEPRPRELEQSTVLRQDRSRLQHWFQQLEEAVQPTLEENI